MNIILKTFLSILLLLSPLMAVIPEPVGSDQCISLNGEWDFRFISPTMNIDTVSFKSKDIPSQGWSKINVPSNWEMQGFEEPCFQYPSQSQGLYRKHFRIPATWDKKRIMLRFEGVLYGYEAFINGERIGSFESAFHPSQHDITDAVNINGENVLAVRVYKRFKGWEFDCSDSWALSGIYRDVSLYSIPQTYFENVTITTPLGEQINQPRLIAEYHLSSQENPLTGYSLQTRLFTPADSLIKSRQEPVTSSSGQIEFAPDSVRLWTAESPDLYTLQMTLFKGDNKIQTRSFKVGFRQLDIRRGVLFLNGRPLTFRGVNRHEIHPKVGRALREQHWQQDIRMMKAANINAVRCSHYPPHPRFIELCDSAGVYLIDEIPFTRGSHHLADSSYLPVLLSRAEQTVQRDKNHASVIAWSVGNENPFTPLVRATLQQVKKSDPTRPVLLPMDQETFDESMDDIAKVTGLFSPHYPTVDYMTIVSNLPHNTIPFLITEYNHSLGPALEDLHKRWQTVRENPRLAGGAIWMWSDQGLVRSVKGHEPIDSRKHPFRIQHPKDTDELSTREKSPLSADFWLNDSTVIDCQGQYGMDGIVYAERTPRIEYYTTRAVYSPVSCRDRFAMVTGGQQVVGLTIENRYDFTDLSHIKAIAQLLIDGQEKQSYTLDLDAPPGQANPVELEVSIPKPAEDHECAIKLSFYDAHQHLIHHQVVPLIAGGQATNVWNRVRYDSLSTLDIEKNQHQLSVKSPLYEITTKQDGSILAIHASTGMSWIKGKPLVKMGRPPFITERINFAHAQKKFWQPAVLDLPAIRRTEWNGQGDVKQWTGYYRYHRPDSVQQVIDLTFELAFSRQGWIDLDYRWQPKNANDYFLQAGLSLELDARFEQMAWLGQGPFPAYPGIIAQNQRGYYSYDLNTATPHENRMGVDAVVLVDANQNGLLILTQNANIAVEKIGNKIFISHSAYVAGIGSKHNMTHYPLLASQILEVKGRLRFIPFDASHQPDLVREILESAKPEPLLNMVIDE